MPSDRPKKTNFRSLQSLLSAFLAGLALAGAIFYITIMIIVLQSSTIIPDDKKSITVTCSAIFVVIVVLTILHSAVDLWRRYVTKNGSLDDHASTVAGA
ncbi:hypothetical protein BDR26DRAFT_869154 [Obelidium mucronatum]|nr:hypothetical protein BDR26DRAFT_869154 [Obelidium mucronatum]